MTYNVLITGSEGFLGNALRSHYLSSGCNVFTIDLKPAPSQHTVHHFQLDITDYSLLHSAIQKISINLLIHCAAETRILQGSSLQDYLSNTIGVRNVCTAISSLHPQAACLFFSSQLVCKLGYIPVSSSDYCPDTIYGSSKVIGEHIVHSLCKSMDYVILRPTTVWGPGCSQHYRSFLGLLSRRLYPLYGKQLIPKSFSYIDNLVYQTSQVALLLSRLELNQNVFYLCDYKPIDINQWAVDLSSSLGVKKPIPMPVPILWLVALFSSVFALLPLTRRPPLMTMRRLRNISTPYKFTELLLDKYVPVLPVPYHKAIHDTAAWYKNL
ncbi:NAD-dependent epimerase/dehydratase family protein [Synechococcus sp. NB0720_010]|uniref:NAD-dependent epimerase/dehydratase family protein n=1 Tax=Synechococcus sp. NB0720_010 TaxID=2907159 RepID=UPI0035303D3A